MQQIGRTAIQAASALNAAKLTNKTMLTNQLFGLGLRKDSIESLISEFYDHLKDNSIKDEVIKKLAGIGAEAILRSRKLKRQSSANNTNNALDKLKENLDEINGMLHEYKTNQSRVRGDEMLTKTKEKLSGKKIPPINADIIRQPIPESGAVKTKAYLKPTTRQIPMVTRSESYQEQLKKAKMINDNIEYRRISLCQHGRLLEGMVLKGGITAGRVLGRRYVRRPSSCVKHCCATSGCNVAMVQRKSCYVMRCVDRRLCEAVHGKGKRTHSLAFVYRGLKDAKDTQFFLEMQKRHPHNRKQYPSVVGETATTTRALPTETRHTRDERPRKQHPTVLGDTTTATTSLPTKSWYTKDNSRRKPTLKQKNREYSNSNNKIENSKYPKREPEELKENIHSAVKSMVGKSKTTSRPVSDTTESTDADTSDDYLETIYDKENHVFIRQKVRKKKTKTKKIQRNSKSRKQNANIASTGTGHHLTTGVQQLSRIAQQLLQEVERSELLSKHLPSGALTKNESSALVSRARSISTLINKIHHLYEKTLRNPTTKQELSKTSQTIDDSIKKTLYDVDKQDTFPSNHITPSSHRNRASKLPATEKSTSGVLEKHLHSKHVTPPPHRNYASKLPAAEKTNIEELERLLNLHKEKLKKMLTDNSSYYINDSPTLSLNHATPTSSNSHATKHAVPILIHKQNLLKNHQKQSQNIFQHQQQKQEQENKKEINSKKDSEDSDGIHHKSALKLISDTCLLYTSPSPRDS